MEDFYSKQAELRFLVGLMEYNENIDCGRVRDELPLSEFIRENSTDRVARHMRIFIGPYWPVEIVDSMDRWLQITFTADAAKACGAYGVALKVSDVLRWLAEESQSEARRDYLERLASALDADPSPRPAIENPVPDRERLLIDYLSLTREMTANLSSWTTRTLQEVSYCARAAGRAVEWGTAMMPLTIPFPADLLPPGHKLTRDGYGGEVLQTDWLLREAVGRASYLGDVEREQLKTALKFYPSPRLCFDVCADGIDVDEIGGFTVVRDLPIHNVGDLLGSVNVDLLAEEAKFSSDSEEFPYRLYRVDATWAADEPHFYLVSDLAIYHAS